MRADSNLAKIAEKIAEKFENYEERIFATQKMYVKNFLVKKENHTSYIR